MFSSRFVAWFVGLVAVGIVVGCGKPGPTTPDSPPVVVGDPNAAARPKTGNAVFDQHCLKCHAATPPSEAVGGPKGKMGGPNLSKVAADPEHTPEWLTEHVKNPQQHKPMSRMPKFEGKLSDEEIKSVVEYMAKLK